MTPAATAPPADPGPSPARAPAPALDEPMPRDPADAPARPKAPASGGDIARLTAAIPATHPRIWWTPERLARARTWFATHRFRPQKNDPRDQIFCYLMTGQRQYAQAAVDALLKFEITERQLKGVANDKYRVADWVPWVFDWAHDVMTPTQRREVIDRYNQYMDVFSHKPWGGPKMPTSNYYWGYFRNEVCWGIASYGENPRAAEFLQFALDTRWRKSFLPYARTAGRGGVPDEGSAYGCNCMLNYPVLPCETLRRLGRPLYRETDFFEEAIFQQIHATTPAPTYRKGTPRPYYQSYPYGDDEREGGYPGIRSGDFMTVAAEEWGDVPAGQYAQHWLHQVRPTRVTPFIAAAARDGPERDWSDLPLDYYAPGIQYLYCRDRWGPRATCLFLQLGQAANESHGHRDAGTFQIWRNSRWLTKESTGYAQKFAEGDAASSVSHNGLLFAGLGLPKAYPEGPPKVLRLESRRDFAYAAVDLTPAYHSHKARGVFDNPHAGRVVREFLFVRPLETLVILDRLQATSAKEPAEKVTRTFLLHTPERPQITGPAEVIAANGDQTLRLATLLPRKPEYEVVDESVFTCRHLEPSYYQYCLHVNDRGRAESYFLHVLSPEDSGGKVNARLEETANSWRIHLEHPRAGDATIVLHKGLQPARGSFAFAAAATRAQPIPLTDHVQQVSVTDRGPVWGQ